jgi:hypothetical protein
VDEGVTEGDGVFEGGTNGVIVTVGVSVSVGMGVCVAVARGSIETVVLVDVTVGVSVALPGDRWMAIMPAQ